MRDYRQTSGCPALPILLPISRQCLCVNFSTNMTHRYSLAKDLTRMVGCLRGQSPPAVISSARSQLQDKANMVSLAEPFLSDSPDM